MSDIALYCAGLASMGMTAGIAVAVLRRKPNLPKRLTALRSTVSTKIFLQKLISEREWASHLRIRVSSKLERIKKVVADRRDVGDYSVLLDEAKKFGLYALGFGIADSALLARMNIISEFSGGSEELWSLLAPWATGGFILLADLAFVIAFHVAFRKGETPEPARRTALVSVALPVAAMAFGAWLFIGSFRGVDYFGVTAEALLIDAVRILAGSLAIGGGATLFAAQSLYAQARPHFLSEELQTYLAQLDRYLGTLNEEILQIRPSATTQRQNAEADAPRSVTDVEATRPNGAAHVTAQLMPVIALVGALFAGTVMSVGDQAWAASSSAVAPIFEARAPITDRSCEADVDVSGSEGNRGTQQIANIMPNVVRFSAEAHNCSVMKASAFVGDPWQPLLEFSLPSMPTVPPCTQTPPTMENAATLLYPAVRVQHEREAVAACEERAKVVRSRAVQNRKESENRIAEQVHSLAGAHRKGNCTDLFEVAARAMMRTQHVIIATDGDNSCAWYTDSTGAPMQVPVPPGQTLLFLLVQSTSDSDTAQAALARVAELRRVFPGCETALANEAAIATFWTEIARSANR